MQGRVFNLEHLPANCGLNTLRGGRAEKEGEGERKRDREEEEEEEERSEGRSLARSQRDTQVCHLSYTTVSLGFFFFLFTGRKCRSRTLAPKFYRYTCKIVRDKAVKGVLDLRLVTFLLHGFPPFLRLSSRVSPCAEREIRASTNIYTFLALDLCKDPRILSL